MTTIANEGDGIASKTSSLSFSPLHLPNVGMWIDATDQNTVFQTTGMAAQSVPGGGSGTNNVGRILNKVDGLAEVRDAIATSSLPTYASNIFGSLPGVLVAQTGSPLIGNFTHSGNEMTAVLVIKFRVLHAGGLFDWRSIYEGGNGLVGTAGSDDNAFLRFQINGAEDNGVVYYDSDAGDPGLLYPFALSTSTAVFVVQRNHSSKAVKGWINGGAALNDTYGAGAALDVTKYSLLGSLNGFATEAYLGEAIVGTKCWSNAELNALRTYINTKYGGLVSPFSGGFS